MNALDGVRVLDMTRLLPGAITSLFLADFGAEVIKIEEPSRGDYEREYPPHGPGGDGYRFQLANRNKMSVTLNLKDPRGRDAFYRLAETADIVIEGFRPGVAERLGVDYSTISQKNPRIIYCSLSGYGQTGPYAEMAGHDVNYQALSGVLSLTGSPERPVMPGVQISDIGGGALMAVIGILIAQAARERTGRGQLVDVSMLDGSVFWLIGRAQWWMASQLVPERGALAGTGASPGYNLYRTEDDRFISVGAMEPHFWDRLCRALELPELIDDYEADSERQKEVFQLFRERFRTRTRDEWFARLRELDACGAPVLDLAEVWDDPHVRAREMVTEVDHAEYGSITQIGTPIKLSDTPGAVRSPSPGIGEHNVRILSEIGYSPEDLRMLREDGVIR